jgi:hypothetical protein
MAWNGSNASRSSDPRGARLAPNACVIKAFARRILVFPGKNMALRAALEAWLFLSALALRPRVAALAPPGAGFVATGPALPVSGG